MKIVALIGSGKEEAAAILQETKVSVSRLNMLSAIKNVLVQTTSVPVQLFNDPVLKDKPLKEPVTLDSRLLRKIRRECEFVVNADRGDGTLSYRAGTASISGLEGRVMNTPNELLTLIADEFVTKRIYANWHREATLQSLADGVHTLLIESEDDWNFLQSKLGDAATLIHVKTSDTEETPDIAGSTVVSGSGKELKEQLKDLNLKDSAPTTKGKKRGFQFVRKNGQSE